MEIVISSSSEDEVSESLNIKPPQASGRIIHVSRGQRSAKEKGRQNHSHSSSLYNHKLPREYHRRRKHHRHRHEHLPTERVIRELLNKRAERHDIHQGERFVVMTREEDGHALDKLHVEVQHQAVLRKSNSKPHQSLRRHHRTHDKDLRHRHPRPCIKQNANSDHSNDHPGKKHGSVSRSSSEKSDSDSCLSNNSRNGNVQGSESRNTTSKNNVEGHVEVVESSSNGGTEEESDDSSSTKTAETGDSDQHGMMNSSLKGESDGNSCKSEDCVAGTTEDNLDSLPPYLPAIQGCRSVEEFQCLNKIEEGSFGVVYRARDKRTQEVVALKKLKMAKEKEGFPITALREINTLLKSQHPNIVTVREIVVGSNMDQIFIVMNFVEQDLNALMRSMKKRNQVFLPSEVKCLMQQLLLAVAHLHDNWILHRDLKTSNLLLDDRGVLKIGDFGLAREYGSPLKTYTPLVVTLWYRSPELLLDPNMYSTHVDVWAVGCVFGELVTLQPLFPGKTEAEQVTRIFKDMGTPTESAWPGYSSFPLVQKLGLPSFPGNRLRTRLGLTLSAAGLDLMNKFLTYNPSARISAENALRHEYFAELPVPTLPSKAALEQRKPGKEMRPAEGFHMEKEQAAASLGFSLKF